MANIEFLLEAVNYEQMFDGLLDIFEGDARKQFETQIKNQIKKAKATFKKQDRVTWYLKQYKHTLLNNIYNSIQDSDNEDVSDDVRETREKFERYYNKQSKKVKNDPLTDKEIQELYTELEHYLSLPVNAIQNVVWKNQTPDELINQFEELEKEWKKNKQQLIPVQDGDKVIKSYKDDMYWVDLDMAYCSKEGASMGHCGNSPRAGTSDTIYSLRQKKKMGDQEYWHPFVTITVDDEGYVWEVKGRGNQKPADRYIPYVVDLFSDGDYIGGQKKDVGYLPENNLNFNEDFTDQQQEKIMKSNPRFEVVEREPIRLVLDEYDLPRYVFDDEFDYGNFTNRPIENEQDWQDVMESDPEFNIANYTRLVYEGLDAYLDTNSSDANGLLDRFMNYLKRFMENGAKGEIEKAVKDIMEVYNEDFINHLDNEIDDEIIFYIDGEFEEFDWAEDTLDVEDKKEISQRVWEKWDDYLNEFVKRGSVNMGDNVIDYLRELDGLFSEGEKPYDESLVFYEHDDSDEFLINRVNFVIKKKKQEALGDDYQDGDEKSQSEIDKELGQLEFDFGESVKPKWRKLVII